MLACPKITVRNLDFFYGGSKSLKGVSLDLPEKQTTAVIGPSGCGKSTLLRVLNRLYDLYPGQRATGDVQFEGQNILGPEVDVRWLRSRIGMILQEPTPFPMSIFANIAFGARLHWKLSRAAMADRVEEALIRAALWPEVKDRLSAAAQSLSGGQQQRLCIARALAVRPEVLLLDEPTSALDPLSTSLIEGLMDDLKRQLTVVLVTHNLHQAARCADQVAFFYLGEVVEIGLSAQMFTAPRELRTQRYVAGRFG
jgi:phosphate transport system ATP-binding protein